MKSLNLKSLNFKLYGLTVLLLSAFCILLLPRCNPKKKNDIVQEIVNDTIPKPVFESELDSLKWISETGGNEEKMEALYKLTNKYSTQNIDIAFMYSKELYALAQKGDNLIWKGNGASALGGIYYYLEKMDSAIFYFSEAVSFLEKSDDAEKLAFFRLRLSYAQLKVLEYDNALTNLLNTLDYYLENNKPDRVLNIYNQIALVYENMGFLDKQEEFLLKALNFSNNEKVGPRDLVVTLINLALLRNKENKYEEAVEFGEKAVELCRNAGLNKDRVYALALQRTSEILIAAGKTEKVLPYLNEASNIAEQIQLPRVRSEILLAMASYHLNITKDYQAAFNVCKQAEVLYDGTNVSDMEFLYKYFLNSAIGMSNREESFKYLDLFIQTNTKKQNSILSEKTSEMEVRYETGKKELEIEKQQQIIKRQNMQRWFFASGMAALAVFVVLLWNMFQLRNRRNHVLEEMNATKDKFFSIISHDLKSPTVAQREALKILQDNAKVWDPAQLEHYCNGLVKSADGLVDLLYNLLNWAQLQTGRMLYKPVQFDIAAEIREDADTLFNAMAQHKGIELITKLPDAALITGDINMLKTVVRNLADNAIKFTLPEGKVILSVTSKENEKFMISVFDTGIGMTDEQVCNLIHNDGTIGTGRKSSTSTRGTANETGTGLGLIVCKELLRKHGTTLHVESTEGKGSTFWFEI